MTFKVMGKTIIKLFHEGNLYKYQDLRTPAKNTPY